MGRESGSSIPIPQTCPYRTINIEESAQNDLCEVLNGDPKRRGLDGYLHNAERAEGSRRAQD